MDKDKGKKANIIQDRLKQNKFFFYGFPILAVVSIFGSLLFFILPSVRYFFTARNENKVLDKNAENVNRSIKNLREAYKEEDTIKLYETKLTEYVPKEPKIGDIINLIQTKADDFSLERNIAVSNSEDRTSLDNLAVTDEDNEAVFESISSGEIEFEPKSLDKNAKAVLLSIQVNVKGKKDSFLNFLKDMDKVKPLINLVYIEYVESEPENPQDIAVNAVLRFESYAVDLKTEDVENAQIRKLTKDDSSLTKDIRVETFDWDRMIEEKIK